MKRIYIPTPAKAISQKGSIMMMAVNHVLNDQPGRFEKKMILKSH